MLYQVFYVLYVLYEVCALSLQFIVYSLKAALDGKPQVKYHPSLNK